MRLLVECFDGYAEGYNYLGLIALEKRQLDDAINHFMAKGSWKNIECLTRQSRRRG